MRRVTFVGWAVCLGFAACGGSSSSNAPARATEKEATQDQQTAYSATSDSAKTELLTMVRDLLVPQLCERIRGSFIGLPVDGAPSGPRAGLAAAVGRWHIENCNAQTTADGVSLSLYGLGWTWVERQTSGFKVQQYLFFDAEATLQTKLDIGYDPARKVASLWMRPQAGVQARVTPRGLLTAHATSIFSAIMGGVLNLTGTSVDNTAKKQVEQEGSARLQQQLAVGFTATWDLGSQQMDFMVGALDKGQVPLRPVLGAMDGVWQVNGRSRIWPNGIDVIGPFSNEHMPRRLHVVLEHGETVQLSALCADAFVDYLKRRAQGETLEPPLGKNLASVSTLEQVHSISLPSMSCPLAVVVSPKPKAQLPIQVRYHDGPPAILNTSNEAPGVAKVPARLQLLDVQLQAHDANGTAWDVLGSQADIYVVVTNQRTGHAVDQTLVMKNRNHAVFDRWFPGTYGANDLPLRLIVYDEDPTRDEPVGAAEFDVSALDALAPEVILPVYALNARAKQVGVLRVRVQRKGLSEPVGGSPSR